MADTLEIFGTEYTNVTGIKATDENDQIKTYIRPQGTKSISENGNGIDVTEYASVNVSVQSGEPTLQSKTKTYTPTTSTQSETVTADSGYDGLSSVNITVNAMPSGSAGTPTATKGSVSNHSISVTPKVTNTTGYITGSTKTGTAVSVSASELVSGSETKTVNGTYDVTNLAELVVNVSGGGSSMNIQADLERKTRTANSYGSTGLTLTVAQTGTYTVSWTAWRSSSSGTMGTNLHVNSTAGTNQQTFSSTYGQQIVLTNQNYSAGDVLTLYATSGSTSRTINVANLIIVQTA